MDGKRHAGVPGLVHPRSRGQRSRRWNRRDFIQAGLAVTGTLVASTYVKPALRSIGVPSAFASGTPTPNTGALTSGATSSTTEGCTPGFWKNHYPDWWPTGTLHNYQANPLFRDVFQVPPAYARSLGSSSKSLRQVLRIRGGCQRALGRHAVAALLNAATIGGTGFGLGEQEVIDLVNAALATLDCNRIENAKDSLAGSNESSCPLGGKSASEGELDDDEHDD